jgi:hypothetical protein
MAPRAAKKRAFRERKKNPEQSRTRNLKHSLESEASQLDEDRRLGGRRQVLDFGGRG